MLNALVLPKENLMSPHTLPRRGLVDRSQMWWLHRRTSDCRSEMGKGYPLHKLDPLLTWCSCLHGDMWTRSLGWTRRVPQLELFIDKEEYHIPGPCALLVSYPARWSFSFTLVPLHWSYVQHKKTYHHMKNLYGCKTNNDSCNTCMNCWSDEYYQKRTITHSRKRRKEAFI